MSEGENKFFNRALSDFTFDVACGAAIRHLHELGYTPEQIAKRLDYPVSEDRIRRYLAGSASKEGQEDGAYEIVRDYDEYGRSSFVRVKKE